VTALATEFDTRQFRRVLGHFPTGVAVVTAIDPDGQPAGMAIGSFTSVSLDPPLVAFLPDKNSSSYPRIRAAGSFCVNFLTAEQEWICRTFAAKGGDKFQHIEWTPAPESGAPVLDGVLAWIDCQLDVVHEAGDHYIVLGRVTGLGTTSDSLPLLFFQGGYGRFASLSLASSADTRLLRELMYLDAAREEMERLAADHAVECLALVRQGNEMLTLASSGGSHQRKLPTRVGQRQPLIPPMGALFVAWDGPEAAQEWLDLAQHDAGPREALEEVLARVRSRGWSLGLASEAQRRFADAVARVAPEGPTPEQEREMREIAKLVVAQDSEPEVLVPGASNDVRSISAPVFGPTGTVAMMLTLFGFRVLTTEQIFAQRDRVVQAADAVTAAIGGRRPEQ